MRPYLWLLLSCLSTVLVVRAGDTNFVATFDVQWRSHNASNLLTYVDSQVATNRSVETLFARGLLAAYFQKWGRGATNYLGQAVVEAQSNNAYSASGRTNVVRMITDAKGLFEALADDSGEPTNSVPTWDTNTHAVVFGELGDQVPFLTTLDRISVTQ